MIQKWTWTLVVGWAFLLSLSGVAVRAQSADQTQAREVPDTEVNLAPDGAGMATGEGRPTRFPSNVNADNPFSEEIVRQANNLQAQFRAFNVAVQNWPANMTEVLALFDQYYATFRAYNKAVADYWNFEMTNLTYRGTVSSANGTRIPDVKVTISPTALPGPMSNAVDPDTRQPVQDPAAMAQGGETTTDTKGVFGFRGLTRGVTYGVRFEKAGFQTRSLSFTLTTSHYSRVVLSPARKARITGRALAILPAGLPMIQSMLDGATATTLQMSLDIERLMGKTAPGDQVQPLAGVTVTLRPLEFSAMPGTDGLGTDAGAGTTWNREPMTLTTQTDANGRFQFADLDPAQYQITVSAPGYTDFADSVMVVNGVDIDAPIYLIPPADASPSTDINPAAETTQVNDSANLDNPFAAN